MTLQEFGKELGKKLQNNPSRQAVNNIVDEILNARIDGRRLTSNEIDIVIASVKTEVGNLALSTESFSNTAALSLISIIKDKIAKAKSEGKING